MLVHMAVHMIIHTLVHTAAHMDVHMDVYMAVHMAVIRLHALRARAEGYKTRDWPQYGAALSQTGV